MRKAVHVPLVVAAISALCALPAAAQTTGSTASTGTPATSRVSDEWRMPYQANFWNYIGATVGRSDYDLGCVSGYGCDNNDTAFKIFAGGKLYNALGMELGYVNLGRADIAGGRTRAQGANISLVVGIPVWGDRFGINGKVGTTYGWTNTGASAPDYETGKESGWGLSYGAGATYAITRNTELRVDWDRYRFDFRGAGHQDVDLLSAGVNFRF